MKRATLAAILVLMVFTAMFMMSGAVLADTYTFTGLGGGASALSFAYGGGNTYVGMADGHIWQGTNNSGNWAWMDLGSPDSPGNTVNALTWGYYEKSDLSTIQTIWAGTSSGQVYVYLGDGVWGWTGYAGYGGSVTSIVSTGNLPSDLYAGSSNGHVYNFRGSAGDTEWWDAHDFSSGVVSVAAGGGYVKVGLANGHVWNGYGADEHGTGNWTTDFGYCGSTNARVFYANNIYVTCDNTHVYQILGVGSFVDMGFPSGWPVYAICGAGTNLYAGDGYGTVWVWTGGMSWGNTSMPNTAVNAVRGMVNDGSNFFACCADSRTNEYVSGTWTNIWPTFGAQVNAVLGSGSSLWAGCVNGQVYFRSGNWVAEGNNIGSQVLSLGLTDTRLYAGCKNGNVYYENVSTWTSTSGPGSPANALAFDGVDLYAGCADGHIRFYNEGGGGWVDGADTASGAVNALAWTGSSLYAATQNGEVYRYVDMGVQPTGLNTGGAATLSLCWNGTTLWAGTDSGHIYSYNGSNWTDINPSGWRDVHSLTAVDGTVFAGTEGGTIYRYVGGTNWAESGRAGTANIESLATYAGGGLWTGSAQGSWRGTLDVPPSVTTGPATSITPSGATLSGNITATGGANADARGFRYRKTGAGSWTEWTEAGSFDTGGFSHGITALDAATDYEFQACAHNWTGWTYGGTLTFKTAPSPKPVVGSVAPSSGAPGTQVTVTGSNFGSSQGSSTVTVGGVAAQVVSWSNTKIVIVVPDGTEGGAVVVTTDQGGSNTDKDFTVVTSTWYLAEGTNAWGFNTYITIQNPGLGAVHARLTYLDPNGAASGKGIAGTRTVVLPARSQTTVSTASDIGKVDFSTKVECLEGQSIAVDRTMFWTGPGYSASQSGYHSSIGATAPSKTWYLPEGSSNWGFETWTLVENPNSVPANLTLTYMTETQGPKALAKRIPPNSRATYGMVSDIGAADASIQVQSDQPVVAERSVYRNNRREGSCSIGATSPSSDFFLAEGAAGYNVGFITYVLVQNPSSAANVVTLTYQTQAGKVSGPCFTMQPNSRKTVRLNDQFSNDTNISTSVHGTRPLVAERAMYWNNGTGEAFHASIGLPSPHMSFFLPDGQTSGGWETWTLIQNPNPAAVTVRITYLPAGGGAPVSFTDEIAANSRSTYSMASKISSGRASVMVQSLDGARPVMVERAMYMNSRGGGAETIGGYLD
jgi:hypothetical protein